MEREFQRLWGDIERTEATLVADVGEMLELRKQDAKRKQARPNPHPNPNAHPHPDANPHPHPHPYPSPHLTRGCCTVSGTRRSSSRSSTRSP